MELEAGEESSSSIREEEGEYTTASLGAATVLEVVEQYVAGLRGTTHSHLETLSDAANSHMMTAHPIQSVSQSINQVSKQSSKGKEETNVKRSTFRPPQQQQLNRL